MDAPIFSKAIPLAPKHAVETVRALRLVTFNEKNVASPDLTHAL